MPAGPGRQALLLRVGIDRGTGGALAPIFPDGSFEYVPIPEPGATRCSLTFAALPARRGGSLAVFVPHRIAGLHPHIDPDFAAWSYGDAALSKRRQLLRLTPGDLLVFYVGLAPRPADDIPRLHVIGWFVVEEVHNLGPQDVRTDSELRRRFGNTAHFLRDPPDPQFALVTGEPKRSRLLQHALPLGDGRDRLLCDIAAFGYQGSLRRAVGHWLCDPELTALESWLRHGPASLIAEDTRLFRVTQAALRPAPECRGDLVVADPRPVVGDWVCACEDGPEAGFTLARINRRDTSGLASTSLFWSFRSRAAQPILATDRRLSEDPSPLSIRRLVARLAARWRIGIHEKPTEGVRLRPPQRSRLGPAPQV
jgi:hypothetical protein